MTADMNRPVRLLHKMPKPDKEPRNWCQSCNRRVEPLIDSHGPYCPFCQTDLKSPMERR